MISNLKRLQDFIGQKKITNNLKIYIWAAIKEGRQLDHCILFGSPGLGKTTLAHLIAKELKVNIHSIHAGNIRFTSDILTLLTKLKKGDVLFIDEIHSLDNKIEEMFYSVMENNYLDIILGKDISAKPIRLNIPSFTLIGATTELGAINKPLLDRFGIKLFFDRYSDDDITKILLKHSKNSNIEVSEGACKVIASCSRGTPRVAKTLLKRCIDHSLYKQKNSIDDKDSIKYLHAVGVAKSGINENEYKYLKCLSTHNKYIGLESIAMFIDMPINTIKQNVEPYLIQSGFVQRTLNGRKITKKGMTLINDINN